MCYCLLCAASRSFAATSACAPGAAGVTHLMEILIEARKDSHSSLVQLPGLSMRCPSLSNLKSSSTGMPGYGEPPKVKISHISTPNDQLKGQKIIQTLQHLFKRICGNKDLNQQTVQSWHTVIFVLTSCANMLKLSIKICES